eukprot:284661-Lingulodinium_polyedra.AAC.1
MASRRSVLIRTSVRTLGGGPCTRLVAATRSGRLCPTSHWQEPKPLRSSVFSRALSSTSGVETRRRGTGTSSMFFANVA